jgi:endogenous inhibitor of DNA gyrase (YacG/DUF329 family)
MDLGNWLAERYRINAAEDEEPAGDPSQPREAIKGNRG